MKLSPLYVALMLFPGLAISAQEQALDLPPTVVTRATPLETVIPASVAVVDREEIERSGAITLIDVLRKQAGVQIRDTLGDGNRVAISLRGFGENAANNTLVLVDGRRLNQPSLASPDLNSVPLANIERVEIIRGAGTVLYGDQAVGGVINIITRTPNEQQVHVEAARGSYDLEAYRGHVYQPLGAGFSVYASGENRTANNYRDHNNSKYTNGFGRLRYDHTSGWMLYEYQSVDEELLYPGALTLAQRREDRRQSISDAWNDNKTQVHRYAFEQQLGDVWAANFDYSHSDRDGVGSFGSGSEFEQGTRIETFSPRVTARFASPLGEASWLLGYDQITSDYELLAAFGNTVTTQELSDWYTQLTQTLGQNVSLVAGYRSSEVENDDKSRGLSQKDRENSTSIGLNWQYNAHTRLFIKREDVLRWANVDENSFTAPGITFLDPQTGKSWELGGEWSGEKQRYHASLFRLELDNELLYDPTATGPFGPFGANINLDRTLRQGILLEADRDVTERLQLGAQYTFTDSEYRAGSFKGNEVPWVARHSGSLYGSYEFLPRLVGYVEAVYTGDRYLSGDDANDSPRAGGYTLINAAVSYEINGFDATLRVNNLTGKEYDAFATLFGRYPASEEQVELSVGYRF
ncbi:TonB-dependent receptor family protein [Halopseudomonas sp.]|uniref:TonB-dependent receptor family protein n=1 Tax=Halopseudomonas sp. TaxID=2901191 RepID=UPI003564D139